MPKLSMFMLFDSVSNVSVQPNVNIPQLMGPQIALRPMYIPGNFSFGISVGVTEVDLKKTNVVKFIVEGPDGQALQDSGESSFPPIVDYDDNLPDKYHGFVLTLGIHNLVIEKPGEYLFRLWINGEEMSPQIIPIFKGKRP